MLRVAAVDATCQGCTVVGDVCGIASGHGGQGDEGHLVGINDIRKVALIVRIVGAGIGTHVIHRVGISLCLRLISIDHCCSVRIIGFFEVGVRHFRIYASGIGQGAPSHAVGVHGVARLRCDRVSHDGLVLGIRINTNRIDGDSRFVVIRCKGHRLAGVGASTVGGVGLHIVGGVGSQ